MHIVVLSPHRDDAAFSCSLMLTALLATGSAVTIRNVCTVSSYAPYLQPNGSDRVHQVTSARQAEDTAFVQRLVQNAGVSPQQVQLSDLAWQDLPLRWGVDAAEALAPHPLRSSEVEALSQVLLPSQDADLVLAPMAIGGHIDHRLVHQAALDIVPQRSLAFYQDLPYACTLADHSAASIPSGTQPAWFPPHQHPGTRAKNLKRDYALCYPTQIAPELAGAMERYAAAHNYGECIVASPDALASLHSQLCGQGATA